MPELKPLTVDAKEKLVRKSPNVVTAPRVRVVRASDPGSEEGIRILAFGDPGTGKTKAVADLLEEGLKVLYVPVEVGGGDGFSTVRLHLKETNRNELLQNVHIVAGLESYDDVADFLANPESYFPDIYEQDIDIVVFDGFSVFQLLHIAEEVEPVKGDDAEETLKLDQQSFGKLKNATARNLSRFLRMNNRKTGKKWHKYVTCLEDEKERRKGTAINLSTNKQDLAQYDAKSTILIQGAAKKLVESAFDVIIHTRVRVDNLSKTKDRIFEYETSPNEKLTAKSRGYKLDPIEPGDMGALWRKIQNQLK